MRKNECHLLIACWLQLRPVQEIKYRIYPTCYDSKQSLLVEVYYSAPTKHDQKWRCLDYCPSDGFSYPSLTLSEKLLKGNDSSLHLYLCSDTIHHQLREKANWELPDPG